VVPLGVAVQALGSTTRPPRQAAAPNTHGSAHLWCARRRLQPCVLRAVVRRGVSVVLLLARQRGGRGRAAPAPPLPPPAAELPDAPLLSAEDLAPAPPAPADPAADCVLNCAR